DLPRGLVEEAEFLRLAQTAEGRHLPVMDERIAGAPDLVARGAHAADVIPVLEHSDSELLIQGTDALVDRPPHPDAEERQRRDGERLAVVRAGPRRRPGRQPVDVPVADVD